MAIIGTDIKNNQNYKINLKSFKLLVSKFDDEKKRKLLKEKNIHLLEWKYTIEMNKKRVKKEINKITNVR